MRRTKSAKVSWSVMAQLTRERPSYLDPIVPAAARPCPPNTPGRGPKAGRIPGILCPPRPGTAVSFMGEQYRAHRSPRRALTLWISPFPVALRHRVRPGRARREGRALPTCLAPYSYEGPGTGVSVVTAAFNNANVPDLAAAHYAPFYLENDYVSLNLGRGAGTFESRRLY